MLPNLARVLILLAWSASIAWHWQRHHVPAGAARQVALMLHLHERLHYGLCVNQGGRQRRLGGLTWSCRHEAGLLREDAALHIEDAALLPGWATISAMVPDPELRSMLRQARISLATLHDEAGRCLALDAKASCAGLDGSAHANLGPGGIQISWTAGGLSGHREFAAIPAVVGVELVAALPAMLQPGERFSLQLASFDPAGGMPKARSLSYRVLALEEIETPLGWESLLHLESWDGDERIASLWCDQNGLIWRQRWDEVALEMDLDQRDEQGEGK